MRRFATPRPKGIGAIFIPPLTALRARSSPFLHSALPGRRGKRLSRIVARCQPRQRHMVGRRADADPLTYYQGV